MSIPFKAIVVRVSEDKKYTRSIEERSIDDLPKGEVLIRVHYSSLNYKDGLSCIGNPGVTRHYPHTPGIDAAGIVESSKSSDFKAGDSVIVISFDLGANTAGGFGQFIRVPANWVMPLPKGLTLRESMIYGTAGYAAGLSVNIIQKHGIKPERGPILVTGATGGVGSVSVAVLSELGYLVSASTGKPDAEGFLKSLGASELIGRKEMDDKFGRTLLKEDWASAVDTVGGNTLATLLKSCKQGGVVVSAGLVSSSNLSTTVFPFILRGICMQGTGASETSMSLRREIWSKLAGKWKPKELGRIAVDCRLEQLNPEIDRILVGGQRGRIVVDLT